MAQNRWSQTPLGWCFSAKAKAGPARDLRHHFVVEHKVDLEVRRLLGANLALQVAHQRLQEELEVQPPEVLQAALELRPDSEMREIF